MIFAERIWTEVAEGNGQLATNVAVVPRAFPFSWHGNRRIQSQALGIILVKTTMAHSAREQIFLA